MNDQCAKIDLTKRAYFSNSQSKVGDLVFHLFCLSNIFFKKCLTLPIYKHIVQKSKILVSQNLRNLTQSLCS